MDKILRSKVLFKQFYHQGNGSRVFSASTAESGNQLLEGGIMAELFQHGGLMVLLEEGENSGYIGYHVMQERVSVLPNWRTPFFLWEEREVLAIHQ